MFCYQIRQSFKPGEITPEEANRVWAMRRPCDGRRQTRLFVATHRPSPPYPQPHLLQFNRAGLCPHKYRIFSDRPAPAALSDRVCLENDLSVITNPKLHSKGVSSTYGQWIGERPVCTAGLRLAIGDALAKSPLTSRRFYGSWRGPGMP